ncbi:MAG: glycosyltransferase [Saprospiraceae bacterium]|nr:glycosyltransferase [Saprospiraceae bacterium]
MMANPAKTFLSVILIIDNERFANQLSLELPRLYDYVKQTFKDFEFILVNNLGKSISDDKFEQLDADIRQNTFILNLSQQTHFNNAVLAGFDRSNGDYTLLLEHDFFEDLNLIGLLYEQTQTGNDIVYLRGNRKKLGFFSNILYKSFIRILGRYSDLKLDAHAHNTRLISRRALNSLLRLRENVRFMKALYAVVGYNSSYINVEKSVSHTDRTLGEQFRTSLLAITSFSTFLRSLMLWIFVLSLGILFVVISNTLLVKFTNYDIFGAYHEAVPGWAFLVVLSSTFFAITCLNLYIISVYLSNIYQEIKKRPLYIIESIKRI